MALSADALNAMLKVCEQYTEEEEEMNFIETHDSYKKLRQKYCLYNYEIVYTV